MQIQPYLFFNGRCDEAIALYKDALGAQVNQLLRYKESPEPAPPGTLPPGFEDKVMHASLQIGDATVFISDGDHDGGPQFQGFSLSLILPDEEKVRSAFAALSEGGKVNMPPAKTFWSPCFGMLNDRFGVGWMLWVADQA
jgi:PhnB protein